MSITRLYMSMSLDGFISGPNVRDDNGLGDGGERLHTWLFPVAPGGVNQQVQDEFMATRAVIAGRGTFEPAYGWRGDHHDGVPIFIVSRRKRPDWTSGFDKVRYFEEVAEAFAAARSAAGDGVILVHGARVTQVAMAAGLLDEIEIHLVPVVLGGGRPLFDPLAFRQVELERLRVLAGEAGVTHLRYRVGR